MNIVRSGWWTWIFISGLLLTFLLSVILVLLNGVKIPSHPAFIDFSPMLIWFIVSFVWVSQWGSSEQQGTQRAGTFGLVGLLGFTAAFIISALALLEQSFLLLFVGIIAFYGISGWCWYLLRKYIHHEFHVDLWKQPFFWGSMALLILNVFLTVFVNSLFGSLIGTIAFVVALSGIYFGLGRYILHQLKNNKVMSTVLIMMGMLIISLIMWTFLFIFLGYLLVK